jgi:hypothetical protein
MQMDNLYCHKGNDSICFLPRELVELYGFTFYFVVVVVLVVLVVRIDVSQIKACEFNPT